MKIKPPALWADFNEAHAGVVWTWVGNTPFRPTGFPSPGQIVELWNEDGVTCLARVESLDDEIAYLRYFPETYREPPAVTIHSLPRRFEGRLHHFEVVHAASEPPALPA